MAKIVSTARSQEPLGHSTQDNYSEPASALSNFFGIALIALCVLGAVALMLVALRP